MSAVQWWFHRQWALGRSPGTPSVSSSLAPNTVLHGTAAFSLTVNGANFQPGMKINFGATVYTATFVSATQLSATIAATDILTAGSKTVTVADAFGRTSNGLTFTIT